MIFFWSREDQQLQIETRYDSERHEFVILTILPDGQRTTERYIDRTTFAQRLLALELQFQAEHWTPFGAPRLDADGFPRKPLEVPRLHARTTVMPRRYTVASRAFDITLIATTFGARTVWTVASVRDVQKGDRELSISGMDRVIARTAEMAMALASDCIDKWLVEVTRAGR